MDPREILKARLWVARFGEGDMGRWWRTDSILGADGAFVGPRVLPRTHGAARARIAFATARQACRERFPDPNAITLFSLGPLEEDQLDALLVESLGDTGWWAKTLAELEAVTPERKLSEALLSAQIVTEADLEHVQGLPLGPAGRSLPLASGAGQGESLRRLAAGFARSRPGELVVPFLREEA